MKKRFLIVLAFAAFAFTACEYSFELDKRLEDKGILFVECVPGSSDTTFVFFSKTTPTQRVRKVIRDTIWIDKDSEYGYYINERYVDEVEGDVTIDNAVSRGLISMTVNSKPVELKEDHIRKESYYGDVKTEHRIYTTYRFQPGDVIEIEAHHEGFESVYARNVCPSNAPDFDVKETSSPLNNQSKVVLSYDKVQEGEYLGARIMLSRKTRTWYKDCYTLYDPDSSLYYYFCDGPVLFSNKESLCQYLDMVYGVSEVEDLPEGCTAQIVHEEDKWVEPTSYQRPVYPDEEGDILGLTSGLYLTCGIGGMSITIWDPAKASTDADGRGSISFTCDNFEQGIWEGGGTDVKYVVETSLSYQIYTISPELFRYLRSSYNRKNNALGEIGLSPAQFSYTNIKNGAGVLGAMNSGKILE